MHVFVGVVRMRMAGIVVVAAMGVGMAVMMAVVKRHYADHVDCQSSSAHEKELPNPMDFATRHESFDGLVHNLNAYNPGMAC